MGVVALSGFRTEPGRFHAWIGGSSAAELQTEFSLVSGPDGDSR